MPAKSAVATRYVKTIRAVHPNAGVDAWYQTQLDLLLQEAHTELALMLSLALNATPPAITRDRLTFDASKYKFRVMVRGSLASEHGTQAAAEKAASRIRSFSKTERGRASVIVEPIPELKPVSVVLGKSPALNVERTLKAWSAKWRTRFDGMSVQIARGFADKNFQMTQASMRDALKQAGFTVKFTPTRGSIEAYRGVVAENVGLIKSIQSQYLTGVQSDVWQSVNRGADMATLSKKLQSQYGVTKRRAALISRDQNAKAKATIEMTRRAELGITQAIWQHSAGGKEPRPTHVAMSGKIFDVKKGLWDEDEGEFVQPGQLINCRCTSRAIIPGIDT